MDMEVRSLKLSTSISQVLATCISLGLFAYFLYHLMHGDRGYFALKGVEEKLKQTQALYDQKLKERTELENRVKMLRPKSIDEDLLDERARAVLGFVHPSEKVIPEEVAPP